MKRFLAIISLLCFMMCLSACGNDNVKDMANKTVEAFNSKNTKEINQIIFESEKKNDPELSELFDNQTENDNAILKVIFDKVNMSVKSESGEKVIFEVNAPNMEGVFSSLQGNYTDMNESNLYNHIKQYAENAKAKTFTAEVPVEKQGDTTALNYKSRSFINAITGGLLDEYRQLYKSVMEQYAKDVNQ